MNLRENIQHCQGRKSGILPDSAAGLPAGRLEQMKQVASPGYRSQNPQPGWLSAESGRMPDFLLRQAVDLD